MKIKIYGYGYVGKAMFTLFPQASIHDPDLGYESKEIADAAFCCVPTPLVDGKLDCSIVDDVVANAEEDLIIIRSTVMPGTCDDLEKRYKRNIVFQPEFLGETANHPMTDQKTRQWMVIGGKSENRRKAIEIYSTVFNSNINIVQTTNYKAEIMKLAENRAIGFKVMQMHELYEACEAAKIDYYEIRDAVYGADPRFDLWFQGSWDLIARSASRRIFQVSVLGQNQSDMTLN